MTDRDIYYYNLIILSHVAMLVGGAASMSIDLPPTLGLLCFALGPFLVVFSCYLCLRAKGCNGMLCLFAFIPILGPMCIIAMKPKSPPEIGPIEYLELKFKSIFKGKN